MKALVVAQQEQLREKVAYHLKPLGLEVLFLRDPVKVIDTIDELDPEVVFYSAVDFPRHWKPTLKILRDRRSKEQCVFVLLVDRPSFEELAKASHLGINGLIDARLEDRDRMQRLEGLLRRYRSLRDKRRFQRLVPAAADRLQLVFGHPRTLGTISGRLLEISTRGASFQPDNPSACADLRRGDELPLCTLRVADEIIHLQARVSRNQENLGLQFRGFQTGGHHCLFRYLQARPKRDLHRQTRPTA